MFMHKISNRVVGVNSKHTESFFFVRPCERNAREKKMPTRARVTEGKRRERILQRAYYPTNNEEHWVKFKIP